MKGGVSGCVKKQKTSKSINSVTPKCPVHPKAKLVCPKCIASDGGRETARRYGSDQLREWGRQGGRPKKTPVLKTADTPIKGTAIKDPHQ